MIGCVREQSIAGVGVKHDRAFPLEQAPGAAGGGVASAWDESLPELKRLAAALGGAGAADDILQDVYLATMTRKGGRLDGQELRRWLFRVTVNRCHLENRKRIRGRKVLKRLVNWFRKEHVIAGPPGTVIRRDRRRAVRSALEKLEETLKAPLVLRYFQDFNSKQIAEILGIPDGTVRSRLRTARMKLAAALRKAGYDHE